MGDIKWPFPNPRVAGVKEHYDRVQMFLKLANGTEDKVNSFRLLIAGIYSARAIFELIFEASDKEQLNTSRETLKQTFIDKVRWYNLMERIRIHDFHRFGINPPNPKMREIFQGGPIKLHAKKGIAVYSIQPTGPKKEITGDSSVNGQRPLVNVDGHFFDEDTSKYVTLEQILKDFLFDVQEVIKEFEKDIE